MIDNRHNEDDDDDEEEEEEIWRCFWRLKT